MATRPKKTWRLADDGPLQGTISMSIDRDALAAVKPTSQPILRFFQWKQPSVSYGYLMDESKVKEWSPVQRVKRPTGGGAVLHQTSDLSVSLLWPRHHNIFPEKPRDCYEEIHRRLLTAYKKFISSPAELELFVRCDAPTRPAADLPLNGGGISVCFEQPVCNDVMRGGKKIIGGALRLTREAILYQGNILLEGTVNLAALKAAIASAFGIAASPSADKSH